MYNSNSANIRHKNQAEVTIRLAGEEPFEAIVFLSIGDRLIDLLNDDRNFIPVRRTDGQTIIVAKTQIVSIIESGTSDSDTHDLAPEEDEAVENVTREVEGELKSAKEKSARRFDPYELLRIPKNATVQEIRSAYKSRIKAVHPDSIASLGLDDDLTEAALKTTQKLNYAYRKIMREREDMTETDGRASA